MNEKPVNTESIDATVNITVGFTPAEWEEIRGVVEMHKRTKLTQSEVVRIVAASCREKTLSYVRLMKQYEQMLFEGL
jgi:hypothetical protein